MAENYTGDEGTTAFGAGMDILDGTEDRRDGWLSINKTRDYIATKLAALTGRLFTGIYGDTAPTAEQVRAALELVKWASSADADGKIPVYHSGGRIAVADPTSSGHAANRGYVDGKIAGVDLSSRVAKSGDTMSGDLYLPNSTAAISAYTIAYIDGSGRVSRGASSERYKKFISEVDPASLGDLWPDLVRYQMRGGDGTWKYGYIAERLAESDGLDPFVVYDAEGRPDSIDFIALLVVQLAEVNARVAVLEAERE